MNNLAKCAPGKYDSKNNTCFSLDQIKEIVIAYNNYVTKQKLTNNPTKYINEHTDIIKLSNNKKQMLDSLNNQFKSVCNFNEQCLTTQGFMTEIVASMNDEILYDTFRPEGPTSQKEWLNTTHINDIMSQYQKIYTDFKFLGAIPLNCASYKSCILANIDFETLVKDNVNKVGIVFNHDRVGEPGSHWVALYISIPELEANYCDSTGSSILPEIETFINKFKDFCLTYFKKTPVIKINTIKYQLDNSECGVYSCNFIIRRLSGESFDSVVKNHLNFKQINSCRNVYFQKDSSKFKINEKCDIPIRAEK